MNHLQLLPCKSCSSRKGMYMGSNKRTTEFLKECMSDALIRLMEQKDFSKITVNEIADAAGVNRSTWFRNFKSKNEALSFKMIRLWNRWADEHGLRERKKFTLDNADDFFRFNYEYRHILRIIYASQLQSVLYDSFYQVMMPQFRSNAKECYHARFYSFGLFGMLDEWVRRDFYETPRDMAHLIHKITVDV